MIQAPNTLRLKVGGRLGAIDPAAIAKAEAALKSLSGNFAEWLADEVAKLDAARQRVRAEGLTAEAAENLYLRAHDLKGLGATYEYPLVTRIAGSLCKLIDDPDKRADAPLLPGRRPHRRHQGRRQRRHPDRRRPGRPRPGHRARAPRDGVRGALAPHIARDSGSTTAP